MPLTDKPHIFSHTFNGLPIFVFCLVCPPSPTPLKSTLFALFLPLLQIAAQSAVIFLGSPFPQCFIIQL